jgi:uncharacterized SAM-binding protein YcdF (DUF218 family)
VRWLGLPLWSCACREQDPGPADAIVVLGAPVGPDGRLGPVLEERVRAGVALWAAGRAPRLCLSGGLAQGAREREAVAMARFARTLGVPGDALVVEDQSATTRENAFFVARALGTEARIWLVSQPFHLRRARMWFVRAGFADVRPWLIADSLQFREPGRGWRWVWREYLALARDGLRGRRL